MKYYYTKGLGNGTHTDKVYEFRIYNNVLSLPSRVVSRDETAPEFPEQDEWIRSLYDKIKLKEVYYSTWEFKSLEDRNKFIQLLQPIIIKKE